MNAETAAHMLTAGLPNRQVDQYLHNARAGSNRWPAKYDEIGEHVPRYTSDVAAAFDIVMRVAPYASYRLTYDQDRNVHRFTILGQSGEGPMPAIAMCQGLIRHMHQRTQPKPRGEYITHAVTPPPRPVEKPLPSIDEPITPRVVKTESVLCAPQQRHGFTIGEDFVNKGMFVASSAPGGVSVNLSRQALELALALHPRKYLTAESTDDDWCSAISALGTAPRTVTHELAEIKRAVAIMRGEKS